MHVLLICQKVSSNCQREFQLVNQTSYEQQAWHRWNVESAKSDWCLTKIPWLDKWKKKKATHRIKKTKLFTDMIIGKLITSR